MSKLYIVATPIGNLEDITIRAIRILLTTPVIICEDTRRTGLLLHTLNVRYNCREILGETILFTRPKFISVRDWNEAKSVNYVLNEINPGDAALVSDAGTPLLSDPGYKLVRAAIESGIEIIPIPGPFAAAAALSAAGLPTDKFIFYGFLKKGYVPDLVPGATYVFYESPKRLAKTLSGIKEKYPDAEAVVASEMTKIHEKFYRGKEIAELIKNDIKGEAVILINVKADKDQA